MKLLRRTAQLAILTAAWLAMAGCTSAGGTARDDETQIRSRITSIRDSILARSAEGIVRYGTEDWSFTGPDGVKFDRTAYLARTQALFARVPAVESLDTHVDQIVLRPDSADVEISQTMIRREIDPATKTEGRIWLHYRERHLWVRTANGWCVRQVAFIGTPERKPLP